MTAPATDAAFWSRTSPSRLPDETWPQPETARLMEIRAGLNNLTSGIHQLFETPHSIVEILIRHLPNYKKLFCKKGHPRGGQVSGSARPALRRTKNSQSARTRFATDPLGY